MTDTARARVTALEGTADGAALKSLQEVLHKAKKSAHIPQWREIGRVPTIHRTCQEAPRQKKADADLLRLQTEHAQLATELAEGQARFEALRTEAGVPIVQSAPKDLSSELQRMQGVIDEFLRERSEWMGTHQGEVKIPMDSGATMVSGSTRMEALIDEAGIKQPRVEGGLSSACRSSREGVPPGTV